MYCHSSFISWVFFQADPWAFSTLLLSLQFLYPFEAGINHVSGFRVPTRMVKVVFDRARSICIFSLRVFRRCFSTRIQTSLQHLCHVSGFRVAMRVGKVVLKWCSKRVHCHSSYLSFFRAERPVFTRCYHSCFPLPFQGQIRLIDWWSIFCF